VNLELVGVENEVSEAIVLGDLGVDCNSSLVAELAAELEIVEGNRIVGRFGPIEACVSIATRLKHLLRLD